MLFVDLFSLTARRSLRISGKGFFTSHESGQLMLQSDEAGSSCCLLRAPGIREFDNLLVASLHVKVAKDGRF